MFWMLVNFEIFGQVSYHEAVAQGLRFQVQADSMQRLVEAQVVTLSTAPEAEKNDIKNAIRDQEVLTVALQTKANEWFDQATVFELRTVNSDSLSFFAILPKSPYSEANPVPVDIPLPDGVVYKIQLGAYSKPLAANAFKGLSPLSSETLDNGVTKYYTGLFRRFSDADDALRKVHEYGYKNAFIVAFYNRKTIHTGRARQLENG
jgi:hypothetical protein